MASRLEGRWAERPWGRQRIWESGSGPTLLAVHGLGGSGRYWQGLAEAVGDRFTIVAPDLAGFGSSDKPDIDYARATHLDDLTAAVDGSDEGIAVVGHSLGGVLAALWTTGRNDVTGVALAAVPYPAGDGPDYRRLADPPRTAMRRLLRRSLRAAVPAVAYPVGLARGYPIAVVQDFARQTLRSRGRTMWSLLTDPTIEHDLGRVRGLDAVPTLLAHAADDRTVGPEDHARWQALLPAAESLVVPHGGHQFLLRSGFEPLASWLSSRT